MFYMQKHKSLHPLVHTCQPLKPSMREISPSATTAEGKILRERHFQPKYMTCTFCIYTKKYIMALKKKNITLSICPVH